MNAKQRRKYRRAYIRERGVGAWHMWCGLRIAMRRFRTPMPDPPVVVSPELYYALQQQILAVRQKPATLPI